MRGHCRTHHCRLVHPSFPNFAGKGTHVDEQSVPYSPQLLEPRLEPLLDTWGLVRYSIMVSCVFFIVPQLRWPGGRYKCRLPHVLVHCDAPGQTSLVLSRRMQACMLPADCSDGMMTTWSGKSDENPCHRRSTRFSDESGLDSGYSVKLKVEVEFDQLTYSSRYTDCLSSAPIRFILRLSTDGCAGRIGRSCRIRRPDDLPRDRRGCSRANRFCCTQSQLPNA